MALYFVDGDNMPGGNTAFIEHLRETDEVLIYFAKGNMYFRSETNQHKLQTSTRAKVTFEAVDTLKNAVDFAIAVKAGMLASNGVCLHMNLISSDRHFDVIAKTIEKEAKGRNHKVVRADTIRTAFVHDENNITDLAIVKQIMMSAFGNEAGSTLVRKMRSLFREEYDLEMMERREQEAKEKEDRFLANLEEEKKEARRKSKEIFSRYRIDEKRKTKRTHKKDAQSETGDAAEIENSKRNPGGYRGICGIAKR